MPSLLFYGKGGESESIMVSKENITEKVSNNIKHLLIKKLLIWIVAIAFFRNALSLNNFKVDTI